MCNSRHVIQSVEVNMHVFDIKRSNDMTMSFQGQGSTIPWLIHVETSYCIPLRRYHQGLSSAFVQSGSSDRNNRQWIVKSQRWYCSNTISSYVTFSSHCDDDPISKKSLVMIQLSMYTGDIGETPLSIETNFATKIR